MWSLEQGLSVVRALQKHSRLFEYHVAIGGGVINNGKSDKDLDIYFLPMGGLPGNKRQHDPDGVLKFLEGIWGKSEPLSHGKEYGNDGFYKHAVKFYRRTQSSEQRIDCFIF